MKTHLYTLLVMAAVCWMSITAHGQTVPNQNPDFAVSQSKYMKIADSVNNWHGTTLQDTYTAIDWMAERKAARADRRAFRRQVRMEYIQSGGYYGSNNYDPYNNYYRPNYRNSWGNYRNSYYRGYNRRSNSLYLNPWGVSYWWR
jgi:hypothetical protein